MALNGFEWNQAELDDANGFNDAMVSLLAFAPDRSPKLIGTGFIIGAYGNSAIGVTAAHNFKGIADTQTPYSRHHPSALPEFLPNTETLKLDAKSTRAICTNGASVEFCLIHWAVWAKKSDLAFFSLRSQDTTNTALFRAAFELDDTEPQPGEEVAVLGYADMKVLNEHRDGNGYESATLQRKLMLRCGRVTQVHPDGHLLCRGPCIETSIPVFPGMSGGPVLKLGKPGEHIRPFGLISSDPDDSGNKFDRNTPGASIAATIGASIGYDAEGRRSAILKLNQAFSALNRDIEEIQPLGQTLEGKTHGYALRRK